MKRVLSTSAVFVGLFTLLPVSGCAANFVFDQLFEGHLYRLTDQTGGDITTIVLGRVGICNPVFPSPGAPVCNANVPQNDGLDRELGSPRSDLAIFGAIVDANQTRIGTFLAHCSDFVPSDGGDNQFTGNFACPDLNSNTVWPNLDKYILETNAVRGVEITPYIPVAGEPGFEPGNVNTYNLVSDVPEPESFFLVGASLLGLGYALRRFTK